MQRFDRPRWAVVVTVLAVSVLLGGTGYASSRHNSEVQARGVTAAATVTWKALPVKNGWVYGAFSTFHAGFYKDSLGVVHLRGSLKNGATSYACRLPSGYRPAKVLYIPIYTYQASVGGLEVDADGKCFLWDNFTGNATIFSSLDGVTFPVP